MSLGNRKVQRASPCFSPFAHWLFLSLFKDRPRLFVHSGFFLHFVDEIRASLNWSLAEKQFGAKSSRNIFFKPQKIRDP